MSRRPTTRTAVATVATLGLLLAFGVQPAAAESPDPEAITHDPARAARSEQVLKPYRQRVDREAPRAGPLSRAEAAAWRGTARAADAVRLGVGTAVQAVGRGLQKAGDALERAAHKVGDQTQPDS